MTIEIDEAIERYTSNAEYERTHGNLQGCLEFRQLAEWLKDYKRLKEQESNVSENPNKCDLISREAVEEIINDIRDCISVEGYWAFLERLKKLPSVNLQEPQTGHWIDDTDKRAWKCSECGWWYRDWKRHNFCPYCGARMEQESCDVPDTNVGDIISKQTVLDTISELNAISFYEAQEDSKECYYEIRKAIEQLRPVYPKLKMGKWIYDGDVTRCSNCKRAYDILFTGSNYCPSCGAKMESED